MCSNGLWGNQDFLHSNKSFLLVKLAKTLNIRAKKAWGKKMQTMPFTKITSTASRYLLKAQIPLDSFQWLRNGSNHQIDRKWQNASSFIPLHKHKPKFKISSQKLCTWCLFLPELLYFHGFVHHAEVENRTKLSKVSLQSRKKRKMEL